MPSFPAAAQPTEAATNLWQFKFPHPDNGSESSPALAPDGTAYQGTFCGWLYAITPEGRSKWKFKAGHEIKSSPAVADDGTIYFGSRDRKLYALTPAGKPKWAFPTGAWVDSSPAIAADGTVYFGSWDKTFYALTPEGKLKWKFATSNLIASSPAIGVDGTVYFGSHDKNFYALTPEGKLKWKFATGAEIEASPAIGADGTVYFSSTDGNLYALAPDGKEIWRLHTGGYTAASPVLDTEGNLYLAANAKHISVGRAGRLRWQHPTEVPMDMSPAVVRDGGVYFSLPWLRVGSLPCERGWPPLWTHQLGSNLAAAPNLDTQGVVYACDGMTLFAFKPANAARLAKSAWPMWRANPQHTGRVQK